MNVFDISIILFIAIFGIVGLKKGFIKEVISIVGIIAVFIVAFIFKEEIGNVLCKYLPFFALPGKLKGLVSLNILIYQLIGFAIIFSILMIIYGIVIKISSIIQKLINATIILKPISKIGGLIIGLIEGYILAFVILLILAIPMKNIQEFADSKLANDIIYNTPLITNYTKNITKTISDIYIIVDDVSNNNVSKDKTNLKIIDVMIKNKIVSEKTIKQLIVLDKLKSINGINKYE